MSLTPAMCRAYPIDIRRTHQEGIATPVIPQARETDRGYLGRPKNWGNVRGTSIGCYRFLLYAAHIRRTSNGSSRRKNSKKFKRPVDVHWMSAKYRHRMNVRKTSIGCLLLPRCAVHIPWTSGGHIRQGSHIPLSHTLSRRTVDISVDLGIGPMSVGRPFDVIDFRCMQRTSKGRTAGVLEKMKTPKNLNVR